MGEIYCMGYGELGEVQERKGWIWGMVRTGKGTIKLLAKSDSNVAKQFKSGSFVFFLGFLGLAKKSDPVVFVQTMLVQSEAE